MIWVFVEASADGEIMYHGIINVYKEAGFTSHDVVAKLRGISKQKKIGHTGTLDPDAVGVLPVCLGRGTKVCDMLTDRTKEYVACFRLGLVTDTQDISGIVLEEMPVNVNKEEVFDVMQSFVGDIMQIPPMYSALKVNGKKLYELAREGKEVERKARPVTVYEIEVLKEAHPEYEIRVVCSKGTYIRTLCHDIGQKLGCGGVMTKLTRTGVGEFKIKDTYTLGQLQQLADEGKLRQAVTPIEKLFEKLPALKVTPEGIKALQNGNQLKTREVLPFDRAIQDKGAEGVCDMTAEAFEETKPYFSEGKQFRVYNDENEFCAVYAYEQKRRLLCPVKMFFQ